MKLDFEFHTKYGLFRDALTLPDDHTLTEQEILVMQNQRVEAWVHHIENPEPEVEPSPVYVGFVASDMELVQQMFDFIKLGKDDVFYDLGCGDGMVIVEAAKRGARAVGVEIQADLAATAIENANNFGVEATFVNQDIRDTDFSEATCVFLYLVPDANDALSDRLRNLAPGTRIMTYRFEMLGFNEVHRVGAEPDFGYVYEVTNG